MYEAGEDIYGSPEHKAFRETVRKFVQTELVPRAREFDGALSNGCATARKSPKNPLVFAAENH